MPKHWPGELLRRLGRQIRSRRLYLGQPRKIVAQRAEISIQQLASYESGQGHPPVGTLHRIAQTLGTSISALLGETMRTENAEQFDEMMQIWTHPVGGAIIRYMCGMTKEDLQSLRIIAAAFAARHK
jgi:hypothetical protein